MSSPWSKQHHGPAAIWTDDLTRMEAPTCAAAVTTKVKERAHYVTSLLSWLR